MPEAVSKEKYLKAVKLLNDLTYTDSLISQVEEDYKMTYLKAQPKGITYDKVGSSGNGMTSQVEEIAVELEHLNHQKKQLIKKYAKKKAKIYHILNKMQTPEHVKVLLMFYSENLSGDEVAERMNYSRTWVYRVRRRAIEEFAEYMEDYYV
jgi:DNA-directed RNA polymerase specialized sigma subunit